jgi:superfamily II DNA or RNA helicase
MNIIKSATYLIPKEFVNDPYQEFYIPNPQFGKYSKEAEHITYFEETPAHYSIPRNCNVNRFLRAHPEAVVIDATSPGEPLSPDIKFHGQLHPFQRDTVIKILNSDKDEIVESPCGSGKTVIGLAASVARGVKTAILVPTEQLMEQWVARVKVFLNYDAGVYYSKKKEIKDITIFSIASMFRKDTTIDPEATRIFDMFGFVICDETHRLGAVGWGNAVKCFKGAKRLGLTATPHRPDGLDVLMHFHIGEVQTKISHQTLVDAGIVLVPDIITLNHNGPKDSYKTKPRTGEFDFVGTCNRIATCPARNSLVRRVIVRALEFNRKTLVLINRLSHIEALLDELEDAGLSDKVGVMKGGTDNKEEVFAKDVIIGMLSLVKEGLDLSSLDTVVIAVPVSDYGMVEQILGRVSRVDQNKKQALVIDIHDVNSKPLMMMAYKRINVYKRLKCTFRNGT